LFPSEYNKLRKLFSRSEKWKIIVLFFMMMVAAVLEVAGIGMVPAFVAIVANPSRVLEHERLAGLFSSLNIHSSRDLLIYGGIALIVVFVVKNAYILVFRYFEARFIYNRRYTFSHRLMTAYMQAPYTFYLNRNSSELLRNTTGEVNIMINNVLNPSLKIIKEIIMGVAVVVFLFIVEPVVTLFVLVVMGGMAGLFLLLTQKRMRYYGREAQRYRREMIKAARQGFGGIKDARVLNRENEFVDVFRRMAFDSSRLQRNKTIISHIPRPVIETIAVGGIMLIAVVMVLQDRPIADIIPILAMFGIAIIRLMPAIQQVTQTLTDLRFHLPSVNPIYDDLQELKPYIREFRADRRRKEKLTMEDRLTFNDVHYTYPKSEEQALRGVSFDIEKGQAVAFVGPSGAGKTTVVDVLLGLLVPQQGQVLVDGSDIFKSISAWQRNIGYIPQFIYLADDSLSRNIAFGLPDRLIDEEKIQKAVEQAQLKELADRLPEGLNTVIGERGTRLSGGQRQRVGIARALYHNPQVLVMDEATSALDNVTEQQIIDAIEGLKGERTVIMIAHRLTTVMNCDVLFYMEEGRIVDQGTYGELLTRNVHFREMARAVNGEQGTVNGKQGTGNGER
jgi:ATP-binding cassette, subfamily B, bacterial PglK